MKAFARHGKINRMLCMPGAIMFVAFLMFSLTGCGSSGGGGGGEKYEKLTKHQIETESPSIVDVTFTVTDQNDQPVSDLAAGDFILKEDGTQVSQSKAGLTMYQRDSLPTGVTYSLVTVLLIDNGPTQARIIPNSSPQMSYLDAEKEAAKNLVDFLDEKKQQEIAIVTFKTDGTPYVAQSKTNNPSNLKQAIDDIEAIPTPGEGFDLYGGFLLGLDLWDNDMSVTDNVLQQGFLVALTGGIDTVPDLSKKKHTITQITDKQKIHEDDEQDKQIITVIVGPDTAPADFKYINNVPACKDNGYYVVTDPTTQNKNNVTTLMSTLASTEPNADSIQQIMLGYADSFYWLRYRTDKPRGSTPALVVSVDKNPNTDPATATVSGAFSTDLFYTGMYASLKPHYAGAAYPWYVDAAFNAQGIDGNSVTGLTSADIIATEDAPATAISNTESELALYARNALPEGYTYNINTVLVIDNSPSQDENLDDIKVAAKAFVDGMDSDQKIAIIAYNANPSDGITDGRPYVAQDLTDNKDTLNSLIDNIEKTTAATDFYGSLLAALDVSADDPSPADRNFNQTFIIALTDGNDTLNANTKTPVQDKIADIKNNNPEIQPPQVIVIAIGDQAVSYDGIEADANNPLILHSDLHTSYDVANENGFYGIPETYKYVHGVNTNQITQLLTALQTRIKDYANGFYWVRYKTTDLTNTPSAHTLSISIKGNDNSTASFDNEPFSTADLFDGQSHVVLATDSYGGIKYDSSGNQVITISIDPGNNTYSPFMLSAQTNPSAGQTYPYEPVYTWSISPATDSSVIAHLDGNGDEVPGEFDVKKLGTSTITVNDIANNIWADPLTVDVQVNSTPDYKLTAYHVEPQYPGFVNAMLNVSYRNASTDLFEFKPDLTRDYFEVYEDTDGNGVYAAAPVDNEAQDLQAWKHDTLPDGYAYTFKTVIVIDNSQSQADILKYSRKAAKAMIDEALANSGANRITGPAPDNAIQQEIAIVSFNQDGYYTLVEPFSNDKTVLDAAVDDDDGIKVGAGGTNLYDALIYALGMWNDDYSITDNNVDKSLTQGAVIVITDGYDSNSALSLADVTAARDAGDLPKNIICVGVTNNSFTADVNSDVLNSLDNFGTDGFYNVTDPANTGETGLKSVMLSIQAQLADYAGSFYWLRYLTDAAKNANSHAIKIAVRNNYDPGDTIIDGTDGTNDNYEFFKTSTLLAAGEIYLYKDSPNPTQKLVSDAGELLHKFQFYTGGSFTDSDNYTLHAATYKDAGAHTYTWSTTDPTVVDVQPDSDNPTDSSTAVLVPKTNVDPTTKIGSALISVVNEKGNSISFTATVEESQMPAPLLYYPFDGNAKDTSGNHYDGEVHGATLTADRHGNPDSAYSFNGTSDYIAIKDLHYGSGGLPVGDLTVCAWIKFDSSDNTAGRRIIAFDASEYWALFVNNGNIYWTNRPSASDTISITAPGYNNNVWHFVSGIYDHSQMKAALYVDGVFIGDKDLNSSMGTDVTRYGFIGDGSEATEYNGDRNDSASYFKGQIDDVIIFDKVLPEASIQALFNN